MNEQTPPPPFNGWVAVLQETRLPSEDQVELSTEIVDATAGEAGQMVSYKITACSPEGFNGLLLLGGDARLDDAELTGGVMDAPGLQSIGPPVDMEIKPAKVVFDQMGQRLDMGEVQVVKFAIPRGRCLPTRSDGRPQAGSVRIVKGVMKTEFGTAVSIGGVLSSRTYLGWPAVGQLGSVDTRNLGNFDAFEGISGSWMVPSSIYYHARLGALAPGRSVASSAPELRDSNQLDWYENSPFRPEATVVDNSMASCMQQMFALSGILMGVGGSVLASMLFEWLRHKPDSNDGARPSRRGNRRWAVVGMFAVLFMVLVADFADNNDGRPRD